MTGQRPSTTATRFFLLLLALLWLAFAITVAFNAHPSYRDATLVRWTMATAAFGAGAILAFLSTLLTRRSRVVYRLTVALLTAMILVGFFDQVGLADLVYLGITAIPLGLLIRDRNWYLRLPPEATQDRRSA